MREAPSFVGNYLRKKCVGADLRAATRCGSLSRWKLLRFVLLCVARACAFGRIKLVPSRGMSVTRCREFVGKFVAGGLDGSALSFVWLLTRVWVIVEGERGYFLSN